MEEEKIYIKGINTAGFANDGNPARVYVKDGRIVRVRPLEYDWKYKPEDYKPWKIEARGKVFEPLKKSLLPPFSLAYKKRVDISTRVRYPLKRVDWDPKGERHPENRGKSSFVKISWDEALDIIVDELKRIKEKYGPYAVISDSEGHSQGGIVHEPHGQIPWLLQLLGGCTLVARNADSWEGFFWGAKHVWGMETLGLQMPQTNVLTDILRNGELLLFWGCDPESTPWGFGDQSWARWSHWFKELGIKMIYVAPDLNYGAAVHADKWIPVRPNTDAALQLAIAYVWITEDKYDKQYVETHTVGFDKFKDYVLGKEEKIPKTPKWAAEITGVSARVIKSLAREWASRRTSIVHQYGGPYQRGPYSTEPARLEVVLLAMQGIGKPGVHQLHASPSADVGYTFGRTKIELGTQFPRPIEGLNPYVADRGKGYMFKYVKTYPEWIKEPWLNHFITKTLLPEALLGHSVSWYGTTLSTALVEDQFIKYTYPKKGYPTGKMMWNSSPCWTTCWNGGNRIIEAFRSPNLEFFLIQHPWFENDCLFADLILPVTTRFEVEDIGFVTPICDRQYEMILHEDKCVEAVGESKSDYEICCLVAEKFGVLDKFTEGKSIKEHMTAGFESSGAQNLTSFEELMKNGYYIVPTDPEWDKVPAGLYGFYTDPKHHRLRTPSGKIEIYSETLAKNFPKDKERPPVPHWIPHGETHNDSLLHSRAKKYPFLLMSNHPRWRMHAQLDDIPWFREIQTCKIKGEDGYLYEPAWIHTSDAARMGIKHGDVIKVYNELGAVLCGAYVTERVRAGVVRIDHGARIDPIVAGELDRGGAIDLIAPHKLTSKNSAGMVVSGYLVNIEKIDLNELKKKYPEAFNKPYTASTGSRYDAYVLG